MLCGDVLEKGHPGVGSCYCPASPAGFSAWQCSGVPDSLPSRCFPVSLALAFPGKANAEHTEQQSSITPNSSPSLPCPGCPTEAGLLRALIALINWCPRSAEGCSGVVLMSLPSSLGLWDSNSLGLGCRGRSIGTSGWALLQEKKWKYSLRVGLTPGVF